MVGQKEECSEWDNEADQLELRNTRQQVDGGCASMHLHRIEISQLERDLSDVKRSVLSINARRAS